MGAIIGFIAGVVIAAIVLLIVSKLNLGLQVTGFNGAAIAAIIMSIISSVVLALLEAIGIRIGGGFLSFIIWLLVSALVLIIAGKLLPGMSVSGFSGAILSAIAIALIYWVLSLILGPLVSPLPTTP